MLTDDILCATVYGHNMFHACTPRLDTFASVSPHGTSELHIHKAKATIELSKPSQTGMLWCLT